MSAACARAAAIGLRWLELEEFPAPAPTFESHRRSFPEVLPVLAT